jgi:hypothetical protein
VGKNAVEIRDLLFPTLQNALTPGLVSPALRAYVTPILQPFIDTAHTHPNMITLQDMVCDAEPRIRQDAVVRAYQEWAASP